jgi:chromate reductase
MADLFDVAAVVGSLRRESYTRRVVQALAALAPLPLRIEIVEIGSLPFYNQDEETASPPAPWVAFRDRIRRANAVLFATPEYNRSMPAAIKNAIDVGSRPWGKGVWAHKPAAVISTSPGAFGAFGANHQLRQSLVAVDMPTMPQPEFYLAAVDKVVEASGQVTNPDTRKFFEQFLKSFESWIKRHT